jgi:hypothetical protein
VSSPRATFPASAVIYDTFARLNGPTTAVAARLKRIRPLYVLIVLVIAQWLAVVELARTVVHNGWIYYQGGDEIWYYTTAWLLAHGHMPLALVGYGWSTLLIPIVALAGPDFGQGLPWIVVFNVAVLLPASLLGVYGIGRQLGGRIFGYWVAILWIAVPYIGIPYTNAGYHQRYTEVTLPQALGLTGMADYPSMVMLIISAYFVLRAARGGTWIDAALGGIFAGFGIGIKPSSSLVLVGIALCLIWARRWRTGAYFALAFAPSLLMLALWKWRGYGYLPVLRNAAETRRLAAGVGATALPMSSIDVHRYLNIDWHHLGLQLDLLREHFWSGRIIEWLVVAGVIGLFRASRPAGLLFGGWFLAFVFVKGGYPQASINDSSLLRIMIPSIPAFIVLLASIPLLVPGVPQRLKPDPRRKWGTPKLHWSLVGATLAVFVLAPAAFTATAHRLTQTSTVAYTVVGNMPVPVDTSWKLHSTVYKGRILITWRELRPAGGRVFFRVYKAPASSLPSCADAGGSGAYTCEVAGNNFNSTLQGAQYDAPGPGSWTYRVGLAANWENNPALGDVYLLSAPLTVRIPALRH